MGFSGRGGVDAVYVVEATARGFSRETKEVSFFQAEDGIRVVAVTGVQTCALPICGRIYDLILGHGGTPADNVIRWEVPRSEEHTSELQSRLHLVCRLLLEKKK